MSDTLAKCIMMEINSVDNDKLKLEHIYAKKNDSDGFEEEIKLIKKSRKFEKNSISNCTLLTSKGNREAGNKSFEEKIISYKKEQTMESNKKLVSLFDVYKKFSKELISEYEQFIWEKVKNIFNL